MKYLALLSCLVVVAGCGPTESSNTEPGGAGLKENYGSDGGSSNNNAAPEANTPSSTDLVDPKFEKPKDGEEVAVISTKFGDIVFKFRPDLAPKHVENFKALANKGFYDKTIFHRVIPDFMIQGGDPNTKDKSKVAMYGSGGPGHNVKAEFNNLNHVRGVISMARSTDPDSAGSQFFVLVHEYPSLNHQYTAFGEVMSGLDVADKIVNQPRDGRDMPNERVEMTVKIKKWPVK